MVKRKQTDDEDETTNSFNIGTGQAQAQAQAQIISQRRKVRAIIADSPGKHRRGSGATGSESDVLQVMRKTDRQKLYYASMLELNKKFTKWAKAEEEKLFAALEEKGGDNNGTIDDPTIPKSYQLDVDLYLQTAAMIKRKYNPPTGDVLTFGTGDFGQLGHRYIEEGDNNSNMPRCVMTLRNAGVINVACGGMFSLGVCSSGRVVSWGCNDEGSLGLTDVETAYMPEVVRGFVPSSVEVAEGLEKVSTWADVVMKPTFDENGTVVDLTDPRIPVSQEYEERIIAASAGACQSLCLSSTGRVYFFGSYKDKDGKSWKDAPPADDPRIHPNSKFVGEVSPIGSQHWPSHVWQLDGEVTMIDCGCSFNAAVVKKDNGDGDGDGDGGQKQKMCYTWGIGECGELARPVYSPIKKPELPPPVEESKADESKEGEGANAENVENDGNNEPKIKTRPEYEVEKIRDEHLMPKPVVWADPLIKRTVEFVGCGGWHLLVISKNLSNGGMCSVHSAGLNNYGQLGLGDYGQDKARHELTEIKALQGKNIIQVSAGQHHSLALESDGSLYAFGRADSGQLGNSSKQPKPGDLSETPVPVHLVEQLPNPPISKIASGDHVNLVLTTSGDVYSWGYGDNGALGHYIDEGDIQGICDECRPRKLEVLKKINAGRVRKGKTEMTAIVHDVSSGGQHSAIMCSLSE